MARRTHEAQAIVNAMTMALHRGEAHEGGEINLTALAETAALDLDRPDWLDDPDHEIWALAIEVAEGWAPAGDYHP